MRVVITRAASILYPDGMNSFVSELAVAFMKRGHDCHLVSGCGTTKDLYSRFRYLFDLDAMPTIHFLKRGFFRSRLEQVGCWLVLGSNLLSRLSPHFIIMNGIVPAIYRGFKVVVGHGLREGGNFPRAQKFYNLLMYRQADQIVATSPRIREELVNELNAKNVSIIPSGLDTSRYNFKPLEEREKLVLHVGTSTIKNLHTTLRAFKLVKQKVPMAKLYVVGGSDRNMNHHNANKIRYLGTVSKKRLKSLYSRARVTSAPLLVNTFSCSALESFASGTPVVGSHTVPALEDNVNGLKIGQPRDHLALAKHITTVLEDDELWTLMSKNALKTVKQFDSKVIVDKYVKLYRYLEDESCAHN